MSDAAIAKVICPELDKFTELLTKSATPEGDALILLLLGAAEKHKEELTKLEKNHSEVLEHQQKNLYLAECFAEERAYASRVARTQQILANIRRLLAAL